MKFIIRENQYADFRKSVKMKFLRRVGHRIDEIVTQSVKDNLNWFSRYNILNMGPDEFTKIVIDDVLHYTFESYIEPELEFKSEEQDIIKEYLYDRYSEKIKQMYFSKTGKNLNESDNENKNKIKRFSAVVNSFLESKNYELVNHFFIEYNKMFNAFDVNIFFDKKGFIKLNEFQNEHKHSIIRDIGLSLRDFFPEVSFKLHIHFV